jgi:preprotein translocase subunit SecB
VVSALQLTAQYLKDLSFENLIPAQMARRNLRPLNIEVRALITVTDLGDGLHESELFLGATGKIDGQPAFVAELTYAASYLVANVEPDIARTFLNVEAPRHAYPHAAALLTATAAGAGLPPVWLDPLDFNGLYQVRLRDEARNAAVASGARSS